MHRLCQRSRGIAFEGNEERVYQRKDEVSQQKSGEPHAYQIPLLPTVAIAAYTIQAWGAERLPLLLPIRSSEHF